MLFDLYLLVDNQETTIYKGPKLKCALFYLEDIKYKYIEVENCNAYVKEANVQLNVQLNVQFTSTELSIISAEIDRNYLSIKVTFHSA